MCQAESAAPFRSQLITKFLITIVVVVVIKQNWRIR